METNPHVCGAPKPLKVQGGPIQGKVTAMDQHQQSSKVGLLTKSCTASPTEENRPQSPSNLEIAGRRCQRGPKREQGSKSITGSRGYHTATPSKPYRTSKRELLHQKPAKTRTCPPFSSARVNPSGAFSLTFFLARF
eukprot:Gb_10382 [translate_table: standard]